MRALLCAALAVFLLSSAAPTTALSQCEFDWKPEQGLAGVDWDVLAMTTWDPDGNGLQPELLVVGGTFVTAGEVKASEVAVWAGDTWQKLGKGPGGDTYALAVYKGELIAGWVSGIARWNGTTWQGLGGGLNDAVLSLTVYDGNLIAGGNFTKAEGVDVIISHGGMGASGRDLQVE